MTNGLLIAITIFTIIVFLINKFRYKNVNTFFKYLLFGIFLFLFSSSFLYIIIEVTDDRADFESHIAYTKDINLASEIQKLNDAVVIEKYSADGDYVLKLNYDRNPRKKDYIILDIVEKYGQNKDLIIIPETIYYDKKHPEKFQKEMEKSTERILSKIDGVENIEVKILDLPNIDKIKNISVNLTVFRGYDEKKIVKVIKNFVSDDVNLKLNINYAIGNDYEVYDRYKERVLNLYETNKFDEMETLIKEADTYLSEKQKGRLSNLIADRKIWDRLLHNIEKNPNKYKYYLEKEGIKEKSRTTCRLRMFEGNFSNISELYEKALSLNPNLHELYEKTGDEYCSYFKIEKSIAYYIKAIPYTKNKDILFAKMGDAFYFKAKYNSIDYLKKALEYYNKIENTENVYYAQAEEEKLIKKEADKYYVKYQTSEKPVPKRKKSIIPSSQNKKDNDNRPVIYWNRYNNSDLYYRIFNCQYMLKLYKQAYETCEKRIKIAEKNNENPYKIYAKMVYLDLEMKNYKQAVIDLGKGYKVKKLL